MTIVTRLTLSSGDRAALEGVVADIRDLATQKGAELKGPHSDAPAEHRVPRYKRLSDGGARYDPWEYTVYTRRLELVGHDALARTIVDRGFPASVHVEVEIEQVRPAGSN
ncbi:MAG: 30S ribosomal protein S10 [Halobacteriaceae archaeon]